MYDGNGKPAPGAGNGDVVGSDDAQDKTNQGEIGNEIMDTLLDLAKQDVYIDEASENIIQPYVIYGDGIPDNMNAVDIDYGDFSLQVQKRVISSCVLIITHRDYFKEH